MQNTQNTRTHARTQSVSLTNMTPNVNIFQQTTFDDATLFLSIAVLFAILISKGRQNFHYLNSLQLPMIAQYCF